jgi:8-oxo-dGTP pyrophosphatase MutT (NUDIX family)
VAANSVTDPDPAPRTGGSQLIPRPAAWAPGRPPPWAAESDRALDLDDVLTAVRRHGATRPFAPAFPDARPSAVLIALVDGERGPEVLLTRRAAHLRNHRGEISFPGGRLDPGETPAAGALREAYEEVLLEPDLVEVVGELDHLNTVVSRSYIVPIVGRLSLRPALRPGTDEVDRILFVPLAELRAADTYREERWGLPPTDRSIHFFELADETVWGATGRMLVQLLAIAHGVEVPPAWS